MALLAVMLPSACTKDNDPVAVSTPRRTAPVGGTDSCKGRSGLDYEEKNWSDASIGATDLQCSKFKNADVSDVTFNGTRLALSDFSGASLKNVSFVNADLLGVNFDGARLSDVKFTGVNLRSAGFAGIDLDGVKFVDTTCPSGTDSDDSDEMCPEMSARY
jgi:hypothetical protein